MQTRRIGKKSQFMPQNLTRTTKGYFRAQMYMGPVHPWVGYLGSVGLGPIVKFSKKSCPLGLLSPSDRHQTATVGKQSGSSRASPMGDARWMTTHK